MTEHAGLAQRIISTAVVAVGAICWQLYQEASTVPEAVQLQQGLDSSWAGAKEVIWPPSPRSAPFLSILILNLAVLIKRTFFSSGETPESKRVKATKRRLLLAQMSQALRWNAEEPTEENEQEGDTESTDGAEKMEKRPPPAEALFEMVFDDIEERHVTEYGIPADKEPYHGTLALFKERLSADFKDYVKLTNLARREASGEVIAATDMGLDNDELKRIPEFLDGSKLADLVYLFNKKIKKAFGKNILDKRLLQAAEACMSEVSKEQRKGMAMLWPSLRPVLPMYVFAICLMVFDASNGTVVFHSMKTLLDRVGAGEMTLKDLRASTIQTYVIFIFCVFAHLTSWAFTHKVTAEFRLSVRNQIMANMVRQDMKFFDFHSSGILQERLNNDAEQLSSKMFHLPIRLVDCFFRLLSCVLMLYSLEPQLFYIVAVPVPVIAIACNYIIKFGRKLGQRQRKIGEDVAANTMEVLKEIRTVREFAMEDEEAAKFAAKSAYRAEIEQYASGMHHIVLISPLCCMFEGMRFLCTYCGGQFVAGGQLTPGQAVMAAGLAGDMTHIMRGFFDVMPEIVSVLQPLGRVCDMLSASPKIEPHPGSEPKLKPDKFIGAIEFRNVDFTFPSEPLKQVLFDLSWSIAPGEKVGFVGGTGCGKSTSLYLLERWYNPQRGSILLDGRNIADYDVYHLRRHMSVVAQTTTLFSTTIRENIVYGLPLHLRESITDADIEQALRQANAWTFVNEFPRKLETYAGERGVKLSGGQKQRLAIARAIIRRPTLILLDEATSALDSKAEKVVQKALDKMIDEHANGCTLIIAHRLSTLRTCNRIIVMDKGSIKESGSHDDLMNIEIENDASGNMIKGWYRDLYETQHGKSEDRSDAESDAEINAELARMRQELEVLREENIRLRRGKIESCNLWTAQRMRHVFDELPPLRLTRHISETLPHSGIDENIPPPPPPLPLKYYRTS